MTAVSARFISFFAIAAMAMTAAASTPQATASELPDRRTYELVSPVDKNGGDVEFPTKALLPGSIAITSQSSLDGSKIAYASVNAFGDGLKSAPFESFYIATRNEHGWSSEPINPEQPSWSTPHTLNGSQFVWFSPELSTAILYTPYTIDGSLIEEFSFTPFSQGNLLVYNHTSGRFNSLSPANAPRQEGHEEPEGYPALAGVSADANRVIFAYEGSLTGGSTSEQGRVNLYLWTRGKGFRLVNLLPGPGEVPDPNMELSAGFGSGQVNLYNAGRSYGGEELTHAISTTGTKVFWTDSLGNLYVRQYTVHPGGETEQTFQVDASQGGSGVGSQGHFWAANADGSRAFFTDPSKLTPGSTAESTGGACEGHGDLYEYRTEAESEGPGTLTDLTTADPEGACIYGVSAVSEDGSYVYFVAGGKLTPSAEEGMPNLYVLHNPSGTTPEIKLIATLDPGDETVWQGNKIGEYSGGIEDRRIAITPDGTHFLFQSRRSLTDYDNRIATFHPGAGRCEELAAEIEKPCEEIFAYDATTSHFVCVSCNPSRSRPLGESYVNGAYSKPHYHHYLSDDGNRVFFNSYDSLVPQDTNNRQDVYEWERRGVDSCPSTAIEAGCVFLISTGGGSSDSTFADATPNGNDAFFTTSSELVSQDADQSRDLYDARIEGFSPSAESPPPECAGEECRPPVTPAGTFDQPASLTSSSRGNQAPTSTKPAKKKPTKKARTKRKSHKDRRKHIRKLTTVKSKRGHR